MIVVQNTPWNNASNISGCHKNSLHLNEDKTEVIIFGGHTEKLKMIAHINSPKIKKETKNQVRNIGITGYRLEIQTAL